MNRMLLAFASLALAGLACTLSTDGPSGLTVQPAAAVPTQAPTAIPAPTAAPKAAPVTGYQETQCAPVDLFEGVTSIRCFVIDRATQTSGTMFYAGSRLMAIGTIGPLDASDSNINAEVDFVFNAAQAGGWNMDDLFAAGEAISEPGVPVIRGTVTAILFVEDDVVTVIYFLTEAATGVSA